MQKTTAFCRSLFCGGMPKPPQASNAPFQRRTHAKKTKTYRVTSVAPGHLKVLGLTQISEKPDFIDCNGCSRRLPRSDYYCAEDGSLRYKKCKECRRTEQRERDKSKIKLTESDSKLTISKTNTSSEDFSRVVAAYKILAKVRDRIKNEKPF